jgi:hypothetical protein
VEKILPPTKFFQKTFEAIHREIGSVDPKALESSTIFAGEKKNLY